MAAQKKNQHPSRQDLSVMAIELAEHLGWRHFRLQDLAEKADVPLSVIAAHFDDKHCVLITYGRVLDQKTLDRVGAADPEMSYRDRLFDILMARFDVLNEQRGGVVAVLQDLKSDPVHMAISLPHLGRSMAWMLEGAAIETQGVRGAVRILGLKMIYLNTLKTWMEDNSPDMVKTMAALDQSLGRASQFAERFHL